MAGFPCELALGSAQAIIRGVATSHRLEAETLSLSRCHGRVLAQDVEAGEGGAPALRRGEMLTPLRIALAASFGIPALVVSRRPTVAVYTCGDRLVEPGMPLAAGGAYDSHRELLMGLLRAEGLEPTAWPRLPDDPKRIEIALRDAACAFDLIVICGADPVAGMDHVSDVLGQFGQIHFRQPQVLPDAKAVFGSLDQARLLGLSGDPASVLANWLVLGRPLIDSLQGRVAPRPMLKAQLTAPIDRQHPQHDLLGAMMSSADDGSLHARPQSLTGSDALHAAVDCNALIALPEGRQHFAVGSIVEVLPFQ
ncbi:MAG TPA: molybdopterin-binding protein [Lysobacter sp.]|nr:molybdopterin-binding protein [Lysobacter sp.]